MIIHLTASRKRVMDSIENMREIVEVIHKLGHVISRDWIESFYIMRSKGDRDLSPQEIFRLNVDAIERADLVIVEGSDHSFSSGFQVAMALQKKKPTLLLVNAASQAAESSMSSGANNPFFTRMIYAEVELSNCVKKFIEENAIGTKDLRFNFVIDRQIYNHLKFRSYQTGKTKAEVIRELIISDITEEKRAKFF